MKRLAALLVAVAVLAAGPLMAADPGHVKIAPNNKGDLLIFPFYYTDQTGIWTKLTVVNTSEEHSTVAKVIIKSWINGEEVLSTLIYLSPADVWTGYILTLDDDTVYLGSYDDSILTADGQWASLDNLVMQPLKVPTDPSDGNWLGYVYVINAASDVDVDGDGVDSQRLGNVPGVSKSSIKEWYDKFNDASPGDLIAVKDGQLIDAAKPLNILAGWMELTYGALYNVSGLNATTLADFQNRGYVSSGESSDQVTSANSLADIEAALAKNAVVMPYVNDPFDLAELTVHVFSFPTKFLLDGIPRSPYFTQNPSENKACISVNPKFYDLTGKDTESSPLNSNEFCYEVQPVVFSDFPFAEGWARYSFNSPASTTVESDTIWGTGAQLTYYGAPVVPTLLDFTAGDFTSLRYGAWDDGAIIVSSGQVVILGVNGTVNYHYSNIPVPATP